MFTKTFTYLIAQLPNILSFPPFSFLIWHFFWQEMAPAIMPDAEQRFAQSLSWIIAQESQVAT